ncbi:MAG: ATP synthase F0 subunit C [Candidatus Caldarchaeum sp.]
MRTALWLLLCLGALLVGTMIPSAFAQEAAEAAPALDSTVKAALAIASGFGIGIAAGLGALGQARATASALSGIARNPGAAARIQTPMIIGLALIESLVIYALAITFLLQAKI